MRISGLVRFSALALVLGLTPFLSGCGGNPFNPEIDPGGDGHIPGDTPLNDTVQNTMIRFEKTYEFQDLPKYEALLTADFFYTFSAQTDPLLASQYGTSWGKIDEATSSKNLFEGFTNSEGTYVPPATKIDITLTSPFYSDDYRHADSTAHYRKVSVTSVDMTIEVPTSPEPTIYQISARHEFYLVRGDAAVLDPGQEATADRWYINRWDDLSTSHATAVSRLSSVDAGQVNPVRSSWGFVKDSFLH
jgi:hypothetical protein